MYTIQINSAIIAKNSPLVIYPNKLLKCITVKTRIIDNFYFRIPNLNNNITIILCNKMFPKS